MEQPIGVSILTNGSRSVFVSTCISSLLSNMFTRPLVVSVFDNGSTDDTPVVCGRLCESRCYGIEWRYERVEKDLGCAAGTNRSIAMVKDCEIQLHLESDFRCLDEVESCINKMWMKQAVDFMQTGVCDYLYLRRMRSDTERAMHWFEQWRDKMAEVRGPFQRCDNFWWSNNPSLFRYEKMMGCHTLPLDEKHDGPKNSSQW